MYGLVHGFSLIAGDRLLSPAVPCQKLDKIVFVVCEKYW
jgi:hypothetical protein